MQTKREVKRVFTTTKIALTGKMRSGKSRAADHIQYRHDFVTLAFGDDLKRIFHELNPWVSEMPKPRAEYQRFGQEMRRLYGDDIWIKHVERRIGILSKSFEMFTDKLNVVVTDLRQPNEYEWARANGFTIIRISAPEALRRERAAFAGDKFSDEDWTHDTEMHVDSFEVDYEIVNDGNFDELHAKVDEIMGEIRGRV